MHSLYSKLRKKTGVIASSEIQKNQVSEEKSNKRIKKDGKERLQQARIEGRIISVKGV